MKTATKKQTVKKQTQKSTVKKPQLTNKIIREIHTTLNEVADIFGPNKASIGLINEFLFLKDVESKNAAIKTAATISSLKKLEDNKKQNDEIIALLSKIVEQNIRAVNLQEATYGAAKEAEDQLRNLNSKVERLINLTERSTITLIDAENDRHDSWTNQTKRIVRKLRFW